MLLLFVLRGPICLAATGSDEVRRVLRIVSYMRTKGRVGLIWFSTVKLWQLEYAGFGATAKVLKSQAVDLQGGRQGLKHPWAL